MILICIQSREVAERFINLIETKYNVNCTICEADILIQTIVSDAPDIEKIIVDSYSVPSVEKLAKAYNKLFYINAKGLHLPESVLSFSSFDLLEKHIARNGLESPFLDKEKAMEGNSIRGVEKTSNQAKKHMPPGKLDHLIIPQKDYSLIAKKTNQLFTNIHFCKNKTVALWSPLHRIGVTSLAFHLTIYLSRMKVQTALIEIPNKYQYLKTLLSKHTDIPKNWISLAQILANSDETNIKNVQWFYQNASFIPLDDQDNQLEWDSQMIYHYLNSTKAFDFVFIDFPTGELANYSFEVLRQTDELWILVDDSYLQLKAWRDYIKKIEEQGISIKLIFVKQNIYSQPDTIKNMLELPLIAKFPFSYAFQKSEYEDCLLLDISDAMTQMQGGFESILDILDIEIQKTNSKTSKKGILNIFKR